MNGNNGQDTTVARVGCTLTGLVDLDDRQWWVAWKYVIQKNSKNSKVPYCPRTGRATDTRDASLVQGTRAEAEAAVKKYGFKGVGIVLNPLDDRGLRLCGLDLDVCFDPAGNLKPWARELIDLMKPFAYIEVSPSGKGVKIFFIARPQEGIGNRKAARPDPDGGKKEEAIELFCGGGYFTVTGEAFENGGTVREFADGEPIRKILESIEKFKPTQASQAKPAAPGSGLNGLALANLDAWVQDLFDGKAKRARNGYRVSSEVLGRDLQEDLSISPKGIVDFGVADTGDVREGKRTPIELVMEHAGLDSIRAAAWLKERVGEPARDPAKVILKRGDEITVEPIPWLRPNWLSLGALHILAGDPGVGKSTIAMALAAIVTRGGRWPDGKECKARDVIIWSGEDSVERSLMPAFLAMGGDPKRICFVDGTIENKKRVPFAPARDMGALAEAANGLDVGLLILDPVVLAVPGDSHKNAEVRRGLQPVADLAKTLDAAVIGVTHLSKGTKGNDPLERINGSVAFGALARGTMVAVRPANADDPRNLVRAKYNDGPDGGGFEYRLYQEPLADRPDIAAKGVRWGEALEGSARDLVNKAEDDDRVSKVEEAEMFLTDELGAGPKLVEEINAAAKKLRIAVKTLDRAKRNMDVKSEPLMGGGRNAPWYMRLKEHARPAAPDLLDGQRGVWQT